MTNRLLDLRPSDCHASHLPLAAIVLHVPGWYGSVRCDTTDPNGVGPRDTIIVECGNGPAYIQPTGLGWYVSASPEIIPNRGEIHDTIGDALQAAMNIHHAPIEVLR